MKEKVITHPGIIRSIATDKAQVTILVNSGCASCQVKGACNVSEMDEKIIEVSLPMGNTYVKGDQVVIEMAQSLGTWAVLFGYVFPFFVVFLSLIILSSMQLDQGITGLVSLGLLLPYYLLLYAMRGTMKKHFSYRIQ